MTLSVNIKSKPPRVAGGAPTWNVTVSGMARDFNKQIERYLFLHGLTPLNVDGVSALWSSKYTIDKPALYLAGRLQALQGARLKDETATMYEAAVREKEPEDGLERFLGRSPDMSAGSRRLTVRTMSRDFVANCDENDHPRRALLEGAGWLPVANPRDAVVKAFGTRPYRTADPFIASNLQHLMPKDVEAKLNERLSAAMRSIALSKTQKAPENFSVPVPEGIDYLPFQKAGIQQVLDSGKSAIIADDMGLGKAQPLDAGILTPTGWRRMGDLAAGDPVIGSHGGPVRITGVYPQGPKEIFRVSFDDGAATECCDEHLWSVSRADGTGQVVISLAEIRKTLHLADGAPRHYTPVVAPVGMPERILPSDPYLVGRDFALEALEEIPADYLTGSVPQRGCLLRGILDAAGQADGEGRVHVPAGTPSRAAVLTDLVRSMGGMSRPGGPQPRSGLIVELPACPPDAGGTGSGLRRAIVNVVPVGVKNAQCIAVDAPDRLYVTDGFILTHNTVQGIGLLNGKPETERMIVFCQANMKLKWCREIEKWKVNPDLTVGYAEGDNFPDTDIVVINYDIAARHEEKFRAIRWGLVLTDEAHNLKNEEAKRTSAVLGNFDDIGAVPLAEGGILVHLTGTPKPNRVSELWPLLTSSRPDIWGRGPEARQAFLNRYEPPVLIRKEMTKNGRTFNVTVPLPGKPKNVLELQLRLRASGFVRRLKRDTDLPPKFRTPIEMAIRLTEEDHAILRQAEADIAAIHNRVRTGNLVTAGNSSQAREIIDSIRGMSPKSPEFQEIARVRRNLGILKAPHAARFILDELAEDDDLPPELRRKTVVFAHHKEVIAEIRRIAEAEKPGRTIIYDGSVSNRKRQESIDLFQEHPEARLFIMSLAGATGITLTASHRMRVVEPDWSPSNMSQIEDRIWRIGQEHNCDIGYLFINNSLDVLIGNALINKMTIDEKTVNTISFAEIEERKEAMRRREDRRDAGFLDVSEDIQKKGTKTRDDKEPDQMEMSF